MTKRLQQTPPRLGKSGPRMSPGKASIGCEHWFLKVDEFNEKIIVESWEVAGGKRDYGWRIMDGAHCVIEKTVGTGAQSCANSAARWIAKRSARYAALGVK